MRPVTWLCCIPSNNSRWDCIAINEKPIDAAKFQILEKHYQQLSQRESIGASSFEILTATAFHLFNDEKVDVGVVEVGMGGKLDATNILNNQAVSVISKIARDHESFLGNTLQEIAKHKAGILRPNVPYIVNPMNEFHVQDVIDEYAKEIGAGPRLSGDTPELRSKLYHNVLWRRFAEPLQPFQRDNAVLAIVAVQETLRSMDRNMKESTIRETLFNNRRQANKGRFSYIKVQPVFGSPGNVGRQILVDGAHNPDAAEALAQFVYHNERLKGRKNDDKSRNTLPVTWVFAMTEGKNAEAYLRTLLKPGDNVVTTSFDEVDGMPWVKPMDPKELLQTAKLVCPRINGVAMPRAGSLRALCAAKYAANHDGPIVLTGSLYLVGNLFRDLRSMQAPGTFWWNSPDMQQEQATMKSIHREEHGRINRLLSGQDLDVPGETYADDQIVSRLREDAEKKKIQEELNALDRELEQLEIQERQASPTSSLGSDLPPTLAKDRILRRKSDTNDELPFSEGYGPRPRLIYKNPNDEKNPPRRPADFKDLRSRNRELMVQSRNTKQEEDTDREDCSEGRPEKREAAVTLRPQIRMFYHNDVKAPYEDVMAPPRGDASPSPRARFSKERTARWGQRGSRVQR
jgi:folylpolyglutamate synthase/dihydrofolate synthase